MNFPQRTALPDPVPRQLALLEAIRKAHAHLVLEPVFTFTKHSLGACSAPGSESLAHASNIFIYPLHLAR